MSNEILLSYINGQTTYALVFNAASGTIWNTSGSIGAFEAYATANYGVYAISLTALGISSPFFEGNFPSAIPPGLYSIVGKVQVGGSPAETDSTIGSQDFQWNGSNPIPLSALASSGQIAQIGPIKAARGVAIFNFPIKLVSSTDHVTPFVSGIVSGQILRDNGSFSSLQSGTLTAGYVEKGFGWYNVLCITSGDLLANTAALFFNATGVSGGTSDQRDFAFVLQKVSGSP